MIYVKGQSIGSVWIEEPDAKREIIEQMQGSSHTYRYDSLAELQFELDLRLHTVGAAWAMNKGRAAFASFAKSRCNPAYWKLTEEGGFRLKEGISPADAVEDIFASSSKYAFECAVAIVIILYKAVLDTIGKEAFDPLFKGLYLWSWNYDEDLRLVQHRRGVALPGDIRYFDNPEVDPETPHWQGENVVVIHESDMYFGHGIGMATAGKIIKVLNEQRKKGAETSAHLLPEITHLDYRFLYYSVQGSGSMSRQAVLGPHDIGVCIGNKTYLHTCAG
jgi:protein-glutamine gamma-glutamyltransferase